MEAEQLYAVSGPGRMRRNRVGAQLKYQRPRARFHFFALQRNALTASVRPDVVTAYILDKFPWVTPLAHFLRRFSQIL